MERICSMLTNQDICNWYHATQSLVEGMDSICWRKRVMKLATILGKKVIKKRKYHMEFHRLQSDLTILQHQVRREFQGINFPRKHHIAQAGRMAFYKMPVQIPAVRLGNYVGNPIPIDHMKALLSNATDFIRLPKTFPWKIGDLLSNINTGSLRIAEYDLRREDYQALVALMKTQILRLFLEVKNWPLDDPDISALLQYDGKGSCGLITLEGSCTDMDEVLHRRAILSEWCEKVGWTASVYVYLYSWNMMFRVYVRLKKKNIMDP